MADEAPSFGIAAGDVSGAADDYGVTRAWACALYAAGFGGIYARSRFGTGANPTCLYLFGPAGEHRVGEVVEPLLALGSVVGRIPGLTLDPIPSSKQVTIDP